MQPMGNFNINVLRYLAVPAIIALALAVCIQPAHAQAVNQSGLSTPQLIDQAHANSEISADERLVLLAYALYEPESLPAAYQSSVGWWGSEYVRELYHAQLTTVSSAALDEVDRVAATNAATVCDREDGPNDIESTNFHINYDTIGGGLNITDYITSLR